MERDIPSPFSNDEDIVLHLREPSFTNARNITRVINDLLGPDTSLADDGVSISIVSPKEASQRVAYMAMLENLTVDTGRPPARFVINSRIGTVVMNEDVEVATAAVSHGNLIVSIQEGYQVNQPGAFPEGQTAITPQSDIQVTQGEGSLFMMQESTSLQDVVNAVNSVGATPADLMAILQTLKQAGSLKAELVVI